MIIQRIVNTIKADRAWRKVFDNAKNWEEVRNEIDFVDKEDSTDEDVEKRELAQDMFLYYWKQFGVNWDEWQELKTLI